MIRNLSVKAFCIGAGLLLLCSLSGCNYQRMRDQASVRTYKKEMPPMDQRTVPVQDGFQSLLTANPTTLHNPVAVSTDSMNRGRQAYGYYCVQCHGPKGDGFGTVGQSFYPLPTDLRSTPVQAQSDGDLYAKIRLGFRRHPQLFTTIVEPDTWSVINYLRSIKGT